jgi:hypothetical protein
MTLLGDPLVASLHSQLAEYAWQTDRDLSEMLASMDPGSLVQHFALRARSTATKESTFFCSPPFRVPPCLRTLQGCTGLLVWAIFNPYGPTLGGIALIEVPGTEESLIYNVFLNPFVRHDTVYGTLPRKLRSEEREMVLRDLFRRHATSEYPLIPDCLPSFIIPLYTGEEWNKATPLLCEALSHVSSQEVRQSCSDAVERPKDPWGVATLQRNRAFEEIKAKQAKSNDCKGDFQHKATPAELQSWWEIIRNPEHAKAYAGALPHAWEGSIKHASGVATVAEPEELLAVWNKLFGLSGQSD